MADEALSSTVAITTPSSLIKEEAEREEGGKGGLHQSAEQRFPSILTHLQGRRGERKEGGKKRGRGFSDFLFVTEEVVGRKRYKDGRS